MAQDREARYIRMTTEPVTKLIPSLAVPTIISMLVTSFYNMADTFFVSKLETSATAAVGVVFSLMAIIQTIGFTLGVGSGAYISRLLGRREEERADQAASTAFFTAIAFGVALAVFGLLFLEPFMRLLGSTETSLPHACDYARYILLGAPLMAASFVMNNNLRSEGSALLAMAGIGAGAVINIALDPLFIFTFHMGTGGAALATVISQTVSFLILLSHFLTGRSGIRLSIRRVRVKLSMYREILRSGFPTFCRQGLASTASIFLNKAAHPFGDAALAAMSITSRVMMFVGSALIGFGQGFQPVAGFNYSAGKKERVHDAYWFCVKVGTAALVVLGGLVAAFAPGIVTLFRRGDADVIRLGAAALRAQAIVLPLQAFVIMSNMMLQSIGQSLRATILALARQGLFFIPLIVVLPGLILEQGLVLSQPISDILTFAISVPVTLGIRRELKQARRAAPVEKLPNG